MFTICTPIADLRQPTWNPCSASSKIRKIPIGAPLVVQGYFVPLLFGGIVGLLLGLWIYQLQEKKQFFKKYNDQLEVRISERTQALTNEIVERKRIQQDLQDNDQLHQKAQRIGKLGHWSLTIETGKLDWSDEIYRIFGLEPQKFKPTYEAFLRHIHPEDKRLVDGTFKKAVEKHTQYQVEHRILLEDKTEKWVLEKGHTEYNGNGEPVQSVGTVQDITEIKLLRGILPICMHCKKIRDSEGKYEHVESYVHKYSGVDFSHTICPECEQKYYSEDS